MKKKHLSRIILAGILMMVLFCPACYDIYWVGQPYCAEVNSSFEVHINVRTNEPEGSKTMPADQYIPYFGIALPVGWTVQDSVPYSDSSQQGYFIYSDSLTALMDSIDTPGPGKYWWVAEGTAIEYIVPDTFLLNPIILTDDQSGEFSLDYMLGDESNGLNFRRSNDHWIEVGYADTLIVTSPSSSGSGSLRNMLDSISFCGTILIDLPGDTIFLDEQIRINKNVTIEGMGAEPVIISGQQQTRIFYVEKERSAVFSNLKLIEGKADMGGAVFCDTLASPVLHNVTLTRNHALKNGGGIYCHWHSSPFLDSVTITNNHASEYGGGIFCGYRYSEIEMKSTWITFNRAERGGGIYKSYESAIILDSTDRCNIYLNEALLGSDLYATTGLTEVVVDTFTVMNPKTYHAFPLTAFSFDILHGKVEQYEADLYVSPGGDNTNTGLSSDEPLKTIRHAQSILVQDSISPYSIRLMEGLYSEILTGELFPLELMDYVRLQGISAEEVVLDGAGKDILRINSTLKNEISGLTLSGGATGLYIKDADPLIKNVKITGNTASGCVFENANPLLVNALITENSAIKGGGVYCYASHPRIINSTITANNSSAYGGSGIYGGAGVNIILSNSIVYDNFPEEIFIQGVYEQNEIKVSYSAIREGEQGVLISGSGILFWQEGNLAQNPLFSGSGEHPYELAAGSPCIDAGNPDTIGLYMSMWDLMGNYRLWDGDEDGDTIVDMGAYEFGSVGVKTPELPDTGYRLWVEVFPNPIYEIVHIEYEIANPAPVRIQVINAMGGIVADMSVGVLAEGQHRITWNAADLPAGLYFCRVLFGDEIVTKKIIKY